MSSHSPLSILVVDDELPNREALSEMLTRMGHSVVLAADGREALERIAAIAFDLVLSDVRMPRMDGLTLFDALRASGILERAGTAFAFMTAYGRMDEAVDALRKGAVHFLPKPLRKKDLSALIEEVCTRRRPVPPHAAFSEDVAGSEIVFASRAMAEVLDMVDRLAATTASVLITGESGTGKELIARRLHGRGARSKGPFVAVNAAALPENLVESELFGHERGAFTGAEGSRPGQIRAADGGTFFLDELGSMPLSAQAKWLRVIQDRQVTPLGATAPVDCDVRWVAATNEDLDAAVKEGRFREDLLYRLKVVTIHIPALRERPEDLDPLISHFCGELARLEGRTLTVMDSVRAKLGEYAWPGNVRELRNVLERALALSPDGVFNEDFLPPHIAQSRRVAEIRVALGSSLQDVEDRLIDETLRMCGGDKTKAAQILGITPRTIYRWLEARLDTTKSTQ